MTQGTVGWLCPMCKKAHAPWQVTCPTQGGTYTGYAGTLTFGGLSSSGTVFLGGYNMNTPPPPPTPPLRDWKAERAEQVVKDWNGGRWSTLQELIAEALEEAEDD